MRVLHIGKYFAPHRGGIETHLQVLSTSLRQTIDVDLLVAGDSRITERSLIDGIPITRAGSLFKFASTPFCPAMLLALRKTQADLIHIHVPNPAAILAYLA